MRQRFYNTNVICLYCTMEKAVAQNIKTGKKINPPIKLYETEEISKKMAANIQEPETFAVLLDLGVDNGQYYYDEFTMSDSHIKQYVNINKKQCNYARCLVKSIVKHGIIEYKVYNTSKMISLDRYLEQQKRKRQNN